MSPNDSLPGTEIAIVGMAGRFPGARNLAEFWRNLREGVESIRFPDDRELESMGVDPAVLRDPQYVKASAVLEGMDLFDAAFFGYTPREAELLDPQQRVFLECAWEALENAGYDSARSRAAIGVFAGATTNTYLLFNLFPNRHRLGSLDPVQVDVSSGADFLATRVSYKLNLKGPGLTVQTACSTSMLAVHLACQSLLSEESDLALAGGVSINVKHPEGYQYAEGGIVSPDGHCRAFDAQAKGTIFGSGVGVVVLKRLEDALAQGDQIHAVILGSAINNDGSDKVGYTAPSVSGQANVIAQALAVADVKAGTIGYVEAHGTGTQMGDPIEIRALTRAFREDTSEKNFCAVGSVKSNIGHLAGAAGVSSLIKAVLALENRQIPPSLHFTHPSPEIDFANSPFFVNTQLTDWKSNGTPRRAGVSSFGVGGTNVHMILEEAPAMEPSGPARPQQLLVLSAKTDKALDQATANLVAHLKDNPGLNLADVAYTLQVGRGAFTCRRMLVSHGIEDAIRLLESGDPQQVFNGAPRVQQRPVVFSFTGQGAQYVNMARDLYETEPVFRKWIDTCSALLQPHLGRDLRHLLYPAPGFDGKDELNQTVNTQPALFVIEYALAQLWISWGVRPQAMIGHSIGEYVAACLAGVFSIEDALMLVATRGRLMQSLPAGAMLAVFAPEQEARAMLDAELSLAAVNGPSLCVISGPAPAVEALQGRLDEREIAYRPLLTSHAFHSSMMDPILETFSQVVYQVQLHRPKIRYISNVSGDWIKETEATDPAYWARHLRQAVRFSDGIRQLMKDPVVFLEVGPGDTLTKLTQAHLDGNALQCALASVRHPQNSRTDIEFILTALGQLWLAGVDVLWDEFYAGQARRRMPLPTYPFERQRYWIEAGNSFLEPEKLPLHKKTDLADWFYLPAWKSTPSPRPFYAESLKDYAGGWLLFVDPVGLGSSVAVQLQEAGQRVVTVTAGDRFERSAEGSYIIDPRERGDYRRLFSELGPRPGRIVHLWSVTSEPPEPAGNERIEKAQENGFYSVLFLTQALGAQAIEEATQLWVVTNHLQKIEGADRVYPEKATVLGLSRVISREFPQITCRNLDVGSQAGQGDFLLAELAADLPDAVVAYRTAQRWVQSFEHAPLQAVAPPLRSLRPGGAYLVTGGFSGLGLGLAKYLASAAQARLILVGQGDSEAQKAKAIGALQALGAQVLALDVDFSNETQAHTLLNDALDRFGPLYGVVHAAGVGSEDAFEFIQETEPALCRQHFLKRLHSLVALEKLLRGRRLDFCILTASLSTVLGAVGYAAFAGADAFLDVFSQGLERAGLPGWISVDWDTWQLDGEEGRAATPQADLALTEAEVGLVFERVLVAGMAGRVVVSTSDLADRLKREASVTSPGSQGQAWKVLARHARPQMAGPYAPPRSEIELAIASVWESMLGIEPIGIDDNFFDMGGNSLTAVSTMVELKKELRRSISVAKLYQKPTIRNLAELLTQDDELLQQRVTALTERREKLSRRNQMLHKRNQA